MKSDKMQDYIMNSDEWYRYDYPGTKANEETIKVVGIGGGGGNTVNSLYEKFQDPAQKLPSEGIDFWVINSDSQDLEKSPVPNKLQIGNDGHGAGSNPETAKAYAKERAAEIKDALKGSYLIFITAGMGGGTGTGASPVVARLAREANPNALIIGVVTTPFTSEKNTCQADLANEGIEMLKKEVNSLLIVSNDSIMEVFNKNSQEPTPCEVALRATDTVLKNAITGIVGIIKNVGSQNADFRDIYNIMNKAGTDVIIGVGSANGPEKYKKALEDALNSPLLCGRTINGAKGVIVNFCTAPKKSDINGVNYVRNFIYDLADPKANYKASMTEDPSLKDMLIITVVATDFVDERGNLVTYMMRAVEAHGIRTSRNRKTDSDDVFDEKKKKNLYQEIVLPNFDEPTFMRLKRRKKNAANNA